MDFVTSFGEKKNFVDSLWLTDFTINYSNAIKKATLWNLFLHML